MSGKKIKNVWKNMNFLDRFKESGKNINVWKNLKMSGKKHEMSGKI